MDLHAIAHKLEGVFQGRVATEFELAPLTTYRLGGAAALYVEPASLDDLIALGQALEAEGPGGTAVPLIALGRGSNAVISDRGFEGIVCHLGEGFAKIEGWDPPETPGTGIVAGAAVALPQLANWAARRSLSGLEFNVSIPGSVGGGIRMNAGAHGSEMKDVVSSVSLWHLHRLELEERGVSDLDYSYRHSNLSDSEIVVEARFALRRDSEEAIRSRMESYRRHRAETQPGALQNAGSVFKNPPGDSAGRLVESAGLKGSRIGGARVSELHANFFIAEQGATAQDVRDLVDEVRKRVAEVHGIQLEVEIRFIGEFR